MSLAVLRAAELSGIGLTLLPVFYAHSDFGGVAPTAGQRRFIHDVDGFLTLLNGLVVPCRSVGARLGLAFHSLRAVTGDEIAAITEAVPRACAHPHSRGRAGARGGRLDRPFRPAPGRAAL